MFPKGTVGSNPTFSVSVLRRHKLNITRVVRSSYRLRPKLFPLHGEVPKRLKGHPWKGCRPLIAVRGFKSLLLRQRALQTQCSFFVHFPKGGECADCEQRTENAKIPSFRPKIAKNHDTFLGGEKRRKWNCSRGFVSYIM